MSLRPSLNYRARNFDSEPNTIAGIAVAVHPSLMKSDILCQSNRVAKYNELLQIAEELGDNAFDGAKVR